MFPSYFHRKEHKSFDLEEGTNKHLREKSSLKNCYNIEKVPKTNPADRRIHGYEREFGGNTMRKSNKNINGKSYHENLAEINFFYPT